MSVVLDFVFDEYLRPYQRAWLADSSTQRAMLKARQVGISDVFALEMVLTSAGMLPGVMAHNCTIISKRETDAYDVIEKCKKWVEVLRQDAAAAELLVTDNWSSSEVRFVRTGFRIKSETQNKDAGRSLTGHLYLDEYAFYQYQREIWTGATPGVSSNPNLRISIVSTPNGVGDHFHELYTDVRKYGDWSRHHLDVYEAIADGFLFDVEAKRKNFTQDQWEQEFECKFLGGDLEYFTQEMLNDAHGDRPSSQAVLWLGCDTASVVDTTAVQMLWAHEDCIWIGDTFTLPHVQYETDVDRRRMGQVTIVDAIMRHLHSLGIVVDVTGDMARRKIGMGSLYSLLKPLHVQQAVLPQTITQQWKDEQVQDMKAGLNSGRIKFINGRQDLIYSPRNASEFVTGQQVEPTRVGAFMRECFEVSSFPVLTQDFRKVYRKWTGATSTTFDTRRDGQGHGDAFWAAILGLEVASKHKFSRRGSVVHADQQAQDYAGYL